MQCNREPIHEEIPMITFEGKWREQAKNLYFCWSLHASFHRIRGRPWVLEGAAFMKWPGATAEAGVGVLASTSGKESFVVSMRGQQEGRGHGRGV